MTLNLSLIIKDRTESAVVSYSISLDSHCKSDFLALAKLCVQMEELILGDGELEKKNNDHWKNFGC